MAKAQTVSAESHLVELFNLSGILSAKSPHGNQIILLETGLLRAIPTNPFAGNYQLDPMLPSSHP